MFQIEQFNVEEESFGWQTTSYPQRTELWNKLTPFYRYRVHTYFISFKLSPARSYRKEKIPTKSMTIKTHVILL